MPPKNDDNIKKLGEILKEFANKQKANLSPKPANLNQLIVEGDKLLQSEVPPPKIVVKNPYQMAHDIVLKQLPLWKRHEIEDMERTGNIDNQYYKAFVKEVARKGDELSS